MVWEDCRYNVRVELVTVDGGGHDWPDDSDFNATGYIVEFFQRAGSTPRGELGDTEIEE